METIMNWKTQKKTSAKSILFRIVMLCVVPFFLIMAALTFYCGYIYRERLFEKNMEKLSMYQTSLEERLQRADYYLSDTAVNDMAYECLRYPLSEVDEYLHIYDLQEKMYAVIQTVDSVDALYIMTLKNNMYGSCYSTRMTMDEKETLLQYLRALLKEKEDKAIGGWTICSVGSRNYFIKVVGGKGVYCISVMDADHISKESLIRTDKNYIVFAKDGHFLSYEDEMSRYEITLKQNTRYDISGNKESWMVIQSPSDYLGCDLVLVDSYRGIWAAEATPFLLMAATLLFVLLMLLCYHLLDREFLKPMRQMVATMEKIARGELETKLETESRVKEYDVVNETFNHMIRQIGELKILAYDRLIQVQQTQLQYYQIQVRPHFFLNCMKNLYAMAAAGNYDKLQEMILTLSDYLRSVFQDHSMTIPLKKEMESVAFYVRLQQMVCAAPPAFTQDIDGELLDFQLPSMSILTFVENSFRYQKSRDSVFQMHVSAHKRRDGTNEIINLTIMDNGSGFDPKILDILNQPQERMPTKHIGIYNVKKRFELIYGKECSFVFSNMNGACVDIFIPYHTAEQGGEVCIHEDGQQET